MKTMSWASFLVGSVALFSGMIYCFSNDSGHSGMDPIQGSMLFVPLALFGVLHLVKSKGQALSARLLTTIGVAGLLFGPFVHKTGVMQEYLYWVKGGLKPANPHSTILLVIYASCVVFLLGMVAIQRPKHKTMSPNQAL